MLKTERKAASQVSHVASFCAAEFSGISDLITWSRNCKHTPDVCGAAHFYPDCLINCQTQLQLQTPAAASMSSKTEYNCKLQMFPLNGAKRNKPLFSSCEFYWELHELLCAHICAPEWWLSSFLILMTRNILSLPPSKHCASCSMVRKLVRKSFSFG